MYSRLFVFPSIIGPAVRIQPGHERRREEGAGCSGASKPFLKLAVGRTDGYYCTTVQRRETQTEKLVPYCGIYN